MTDEMNEQEPKTTRSEILVNVLIVAALLVAAYFRWSFFKTPVIFIVTLGLLVAIHEWGHFIAAKAAGVRVYEFAIGFGPKLLTYMRRGGTDYTIRLVPIGGFVNPKGMQPDDPVTPDGLNGRRPAERALVYLAGPLMNVILGAAIYLLCGWLIGRPDVRQVLVAEVPPHSAARQMTLVSRDGAPATKKPTTKNTKDQNQAGNDHPIHGMDDLFDQIWPNANREVTVRLQRGSHELVVKGMPAQKESKADFLVVKQVPADSNLGVEVGDQLDRINGEGFTQTEKPVEAAQKMLQDQAGKPVTLVVWRKGRSRMVLEGNAAPLGLAIESGTRTVGQLGFTQDFGQGPRVSLAQSLDFGWANLKGFTRAIISMFSRPKVLKENLGGPVAIWFILGQADKFPPIHYAAILASLSLSLAIFNLLPIPMLDGGHMLLLTLEVLRRRRLDPEAQKVVALVGMAIIGILFFYILWHDLGKIG